MPTNAIEPLPAILDEIQRHAFDYLWQRTHPKTGLTLDTSRDDSPASIGVTGMMLTALCVGVEHGWISRAEGTARALVTLRWAHGKQDGKNGFFFHFLDPDTGLRTWHSEVSTIDSALFFYGALSIAAYLDADTAMEREVRSRAAEIVERADWRWTLSDGERIANAWTPERGFSHARWGGYNEGLLLFPLALGSESEAVSPAVYDLWCSTYRLRKIYEKIWLPSGPLFTHLFPHMWLDLRATADQWMRERELTYWENSKRALAIQRTYAKRNPKGFAGYGDLGWGLSACDGPQRAVDGRRYWGYRSRGAPHGPDDGTLSPPAALATYLFDPEPALALAECYRTQFSALLTPSGVRGGFNPTCDNWMSECFGLDQGMLCIVLENARSGLIWNLLRDCPILVTGLKLAGFRIAPTPD